MSIRLQLPCRAHLLPVSVLVLLTSVLTAAAGLRPSPLGPAATLPVRRQPHLFTSVTRDGTNGGSDDLGRRRSIPMNGGWVTLGAYFVQLTVGTGDGAVTFDAIVDTGSSNTAIPSVPCPACATNAKLYNYSQSPTSSLLRCDEPMCVNCQPTAVGSNALPAHWNDSSRCLYRPRACDPNNGACGFGVSYGGSGTATAGSTAIDTICFNGTSLCAPKAYVNMIQQEFPVGTQTTGIVGFAFPANACNPTCQPTLLDSMVAGGTLKPQENLFGMCLTNENGGQIDLGAPNPIRYHESEMKYTEIVQHHWFNINIKDIRINGVTIGVPAFLYQVRNDAIGSFVDSGTSTVLVSPFAFQQMQAVMMGGQYAQLPGVTALWSGQPTACANFSNPQSDIAQYPRFDFVVAGYKGLEDFHVSMTGANYLMPVGGNQYCLGIAGVPSIGVILGDIIMANYYIVFDRAGGKLGFAPLLSCD